MSPHSLVGGLPEGIDPGLNLYILGVGGPEDAAGIGRTERFVWRFCVLEESDGPPVAIAFSSMPALMRFTRAVNGRQPFSVPTEAHRVPARRLVAGAPAALLLDPSPEAFEGFCAGRGLVERQIPELAR